MFHAGQSDPALFYILASLSPTHKKHQTSNIRWKKQPDEKLMFHTCSYKKYFKVIKVHNIKMNVVSLEERILSASTKLWDFTFDLCNLDYKIQFYFIEMVTLKHYVINIDYPYIHIFFSHFHWLVKNLKFYLQSFF